jgi:DhnA family fructose-bisphosphate aldolase class Ia
MARLFKGAAGRCLLIPIDHGAWLGPVKGIDRPREIVAKVLAGGANALLIGPGFARAVKSLLDPSIGLVLRVSFAPGLAPEATQEIPIAGVETALRMDADAVAMSVFFGRGGEVEALRALGQLTEVCHRYGLPVLAEMLPPADKSFDPDAIAHAARIGFELGAGIVKTNYCGHVERFRQVVEAAPVPLVIAGGPNNGDDAGAVLQTVRDVIAAGAAGVAFGRRVWQSPDPESLVRQMHAILFEEAPA